MNKQMAHKDPHHVSLKIVQSHRITIPIATPGFNKKPSGPFAAYKSSIQRLSPIKLSIRVTQDLSGAASVKLILIQRVEPPWGEFRTSDLLQGYFTKIKTFDKNTTLCKPSDIYSTSICMMIH